MSLFNLTQSNFSIGYVEITILMLLSSLALSYRIIKTNGYHFLKSTLSGFVVSSILYILSDLIWQLSTMFFFTKQKNSTFLFIANYVSGMFFFIVASLPGYAWFYYIFQESNRHYKKTALKLLKIFPITQALFLFINIFTGSFFYVADDFSYHRGPLFVFLVFPILLPFVLASLKALYFSIKAKNVIEKLHYISYAKIPLLCIFATLFQYMFKHVPIASFAIFNTQLLIYFNILDEQTSLDYLTGINNRRTFIKNIMRLQSQNKLDDLFLTIIDIDKFKYINDTFGHAEGDNAIKSTANILRQLASNNPSVYIARFGGDEFILLSKGKEYTDKICGEMQNGVDAFNKVNDKDWKISISFGSAKYKNSYATFNQWFIEADKAMYNEKIKKSIFEGREHRGGG